MGQTPIGLSLDLPDMAACPGCRAENPEGSRFCNTCGERMPTTAPAGEIRKTVTVVFCDVVGSTALGEQLDPKRSGESCRVTSA
jgi:Double zinc ribbon